MPAAAAIAASTVISAYSANKAAKEQSKGVNRGLEQSSALAAQARADVMRLFDRSMRTSGLSMQSMLDYYKTAAPKRVSPYLQGNQQAQNVLGLGSQQANNAILGMPVDMSFTNQPQIVPGTDHLGASLPDYSAVDKQMAIEAQKKEAEIAAQQGGTIHSPQRGNIKDMIMTGGGLLADPTSKDFYNPVNQLTNPLGLGKKIDDKINPVKSIKSIGKKLKKIF